MEFDARSRKSESTATAERSGPTLGPCMRMEREYDAAVFGGTRMRDPKSDGFRALLGGILVVVLGVCITGGARLVFGAAADAQVDPWTAAQTVQPADLAKELGDAKGAGKPTLVCVA